MTWQSRYLPPDPLLWQGHDNTSSDACFYQRMQLFNLLETIPKKSSATSFALIGFKCDEGVARDGGRTGAYEGSIAIKQRLARLPIQKANILCYDVGSVVCNDHDLEATQLALSDIIALLLSNNIHPIVLGGGHEVAYGHYQGIAKVYPPEKRLGIINFDAHFDLTPTINNKGSSITTFYQIAKAHQAANRQFDYNCIGIQHAGNVRELFKLAKKFHTHTILADELHQGLQEKCFDFVDRVIDQNDNIYMSLSLDVFSPAFAPGVSSIQPLGLNPWHVIPLLRQIAASGEVLSYDIAECTPRYDIDHRTAKLAATLVYEIIHHHDHARI